MRGMKTALTGFVCGVSLLALGVLHGCGDSAPEGQVQQSPEAKKADQGIQGGMKDFMEQKNQTKPKTK